MIELLSLDTETKLIEPGVQAPPCVCVQWRTSRGTGIEHAQLENQRTRDFLATVLEGPYLITGHNTAFDMSVVCANWPELTPLVFAAYEEGRITCSIIREQLLDIAEGSRHKTYDLESVAYRYNGLPPVSKANPWRLRYWELRATPVAQWPREALDYARGDVAVQYALHEAQSARARGIAPDALEDESRQSAADFWLKLVSAWGVHTNAKEVERYYQLERARLDAYRAELTAAGLVRPNGVRNMEAAQRLMEQACSDADITLPTTAGGKPELSEDAIGLTGHDLLTKFQKYGAAKTVLSRIERLRFGDRYPIQPRFTCLQGTGRTSCSQGDPRPGATGLPAAYGYQLQNTARKEGPKECFEPRPGCWFLSCDYTGMELRTWAFVCFKLLGESRLMEVLNSGKDPHTDLAAGMAGIDYLTATALIHGSQGPERKDFFKSKFRQTAKIANFGYPGGMGVKRFVAQARAEYGVILSLDEATTLRQQWLTNWPEAKPYFALVNRLLDGNDTTRIQHLLSNRYRGGVGYCEVANSFFQGLAADIAKEAGFRIARACYVETGSPLYGCRVWNFVHDEFLLEVPAEPARATLAGWEVSRIMVQTAARWMPELEAGISAEPALMAKRWTKSADIKIAQSGPFKGCLIPWEWDEATGLAKEG